MAVSVILGDRPARVVVHVDPLAELGAYLHALLHGSHHPRATAARERVFGSESDRFLRRLRTLEALFGPVRTRYLLPWSLRAPSAPSLDARLGDVAGLPIEVFARQTAISMVEESKTFIYRDPFQHASEFFKELDRYPRSRCALARELFDDPESVRQQLIALLEDANTAWFQAEWLERLTPLTQAADVARRDLNRIGTAAIANISSSTVMKKSPDRVVFDKVIHASFDIDRHGLVLAPSHHISPHLAIKYDGTWPIVIQYPLGDREVDTLAQVQLRLNALNDSARIAICRNIIRSPMTTVDLAIDIQMTQPQVSRHLRALRDAGLVHRSQRGRYVYYSLNTDALERIGPGLIAAMLR